MNVPGELGGQHVLWLLKGGLHWFLKAKAAGGTQRILCG